jgi:hypothetical protein
MQALAQQRLAAMQALDDGDVSTAIAAAWGSSDVAEGMAAYRERRPPEFSGQ